jgi:hypothetical protein
VVRRLAFGGGSLSISVTALFNGRAAFEGTGWEEVPFSKLYRASSFAIIPWLINLTSISSRGAANSLVACLRLLRALLYMTYRLVSAEV